MNMHNKLNICIQKPKQAEPSKDDSSKSEQAGPSKDDKSKSEQAEDVS